MTAPPPPPSEPDPHVGLSGTPPPEPPAEGELVALDPRVKTAWWLGGALGSLQILVPVAILDAVAPHPLRWGIITGSLAAVIAVLVAVVPFVRYRRWRYVLREHDLWIRRGLLSVTTTVVPYWRLQFVDTRQGPIDRMLGLSELVVHTAALGAAASVPGLAAETAESMRERLSTLEPTDAAV